MIAPPPLFALRRYLPQKRAERCQLCGAVLGGDHGHLLDRNTRAIVCACQACGLLFDHRGASAYRRIGRDVRLLADFELNDAQWEGLAIPIGLAFFSFNSALNRAQAFYPGPAGVTESLLPVDLPILGDVEPDVEALLVNRVGATREHWVVPIDRCYMLTGLIRKHWRGLSGGEEVWGEIARFFADLREAAGA